MIAVRHDLMRERMVRDQLIGRGITSNRVLDAFRSVPRHKFVPEDLQESAYADKPLEIGNGQTISQPYMVALMTQSLDVNHGDMVLEVGTGSGYQAAILSALGARVFTIERHEELSRMARVRLEEAGFSGIQYRIGDGTLGWPEEMPFKGIIVTAGAPDTPIELLKQLAEPGYLMVPIGDEKLQQLVRFRKAGGRVARENLCSCVFVKLVGAEGWPN